MNTRLGEPAFRAPQSPPAKAIAENPAQRLEAMYLHIWANNMCDLPFVNLALSVEAVGFRRWPGGRTSAIGVDGGGFAQIASTDESPGESGDWVGAVITPWFINLFVLPGGGSLWSDRPAGERCHITFPLGPLEFIADHDAGAEIPAYQYCPLFAPPSQFASQGAARAAAVAALEAMFVSPRAPEPGYSSQLVAAGAPPAPARRAFFRRVARS